MIANIYIDNTNNNLIKKNYIDYLLELETLKYLLKENIIDFDIFNKANVQIKKLHIGK